MKYLTISTLLPRILQAILNKDTPTIGPGCTEVYHEKNIFIGDFIVLSCNLLCYALIETCKNMHAHTNASICIHIIYIHVSSISPSLNFKR